MFRIVNGIFTYTINCVRSKSSKPPKNTKYEFSVDNLESLHTILFTSRHVTSGRSDNYSTSFRTSGREDYRSHFEKSKVIRRTGLLFRVYFTSLSCVTLSSLPRFSKEVLGCWIHPSVARGRTRDWGREKLLEREYVQRRGGIWSQRGRHVTHISWSPRVSKDRRD